MGDALLLPAAAILLFAHVSSLLLIEQTSTNRNVVLLRMSKGVFRMGDPGLPELLVIALLVLLLFGPRKIPDLARGLGEGIRTFKAGLRGDDLHESEPRRDRIEAGGRRGAPGSIS